MSSSINLADSSTLELQQRNLEIRSGDRSKLEPDTQDGNNINASTFNDEEQSSESGGSFESKYEKGQPSLIDSFNKLFGEGSTVSLLQSRSLEFSVDEHEGQTIVKVIDKENKDVIRQIPSEEFIKMAQRIDLLSDEMQKARGILLDKQV